MDYWMVLYGSLLIAAVYSLLAPAIVFSCLIVFHYAIFGHYADNPETFNLYYISDGLFYILAAIGCRYFRKGIYDEVAFFLYIFSTIALFLDILAISMWLFYIPLNIMAPLFAVVHMAAVVVILLGGNGGERRDDNGGDFSHSLLDKIISRTDVLGWSKKIEARH